MIVITPDYVPSLSLQKNNLVFKINDIEIINQAFNLDFQDSIQDLDIIKFLNFNFIDVQDLLLQYILTTENNCSSKDQLEIINSLKEKLYSLSDIWQYSGADFLIEEISHILRNEFYSHTLSKTQLYERFNQLITPIYQHFMSMKKYIFDKFEVPVNELEIVNQLFRINFDREISDAMPDTENESNLTEPFQLYIILQKRILNLLTNPLDTSLKKNIFDYMNQHIKLDLKQSSLDFISNSHKQENTSLLFTYEKYLDIIYLEFYFLGNHIYKVRKCCNCGSYSYLKHNNSKYCSEQCRKQGRKATDQSLYSDYCIGLREKLRKRMFKRTLNHNDYLDTYHAWLKSSNVALYKYRQGEITMEECIRLLHSNGPDDKDFSDIF